MQWTLVSLSLVMLETTNWGFYLLGFESSSILMLIGYALAYKSLRGQFAISYLFSISLLGSGAFCVGVYLSALASGSGDVSCIAAAAMQARSESELSTLAMVIGMGCKLPCFPVAH